MIIDILHGQEGGDQTAGEEHGKDDHEVDDTFTEELVGQSVSEKQGNNDTNHGTCYGVNDSPAITTPQSVVSHDLLITDQREVNRIQKNFAVQYSIGIGNGRDNNQIQGVDDDQQNDRPEAIVEDGKDLISCGKLDLGAGAFFLSHNSKSSFLRTYWWSSVSY